ncbi:MAG: hypothetical protein J5632_03590 [Bacteroidales bacterium]|nr:hypothetical protein [Bacteroidales bacterium]
MNAFNRICASIVGLVLFVAGVLKLADPVGAGLMVQDYLSFLHLGFLRFAAGFLAVVFALAECGIGAALITGLWRRIVALAAAGLIGFFTLLTLIILIANPAMDCGCFGQVIKLSHWASFLKNVVMLGLLALAYWPLRDYGEPQRVKYASFGIVSVSVLLFTLYNCLSIPTVDFASYKPGTELDVCEPEVFSFFDAGGNYVEEDAFRGPVMLISVYDPGKISRRGVEKISAFARKASALGFKPFLLVASAPGEIEGALSAPGLFGITYFADRRMLLTLNRSNGGVTFVSNAQVVRKWSAGTRPDDDTLQSLLAEDPLEAVVHSRNRGNLSLQAFLLYTSAVLLLL